MATGDVEFGAGGGSGAGGDAYNIKKKKYSDQKLSSFRNKKGRLPFKGKGYNFFFFLIKGKRLLFKRMYVFPKKRGTFLFKRKGYILSEEKMETAV